jgi:hypothetical protein
MTNPNFNLSEQLGGLVRHALTVGGGALAAQGIVTNSEAELLGSAAMIVGGLFWSAGRKWFDRKNGKVA